MGEILQIRDLKVSYGGIDAVRGISFDVREGEVVTLIGANGAGKSSTLRAISGLVKPRGGNILFNGEDITGKDSTQIVSKGLMMVPEGRKIFPNLTVLENLRIGAYLRNDDLTSDLEMVFNYFPRLKERSWHYSSSDRAERQYGAPRGGPRLCHREWKNNHGRLRQRTAGG